MEFEFDSAKSMSNLEKHGISFDGAKQLWRDPRVLILKARHNVEPRWVAVGSIGEKHWSAIFTYRSERVRIISVRRSRSKEVALYES
jgi:uncharacterized DUF497 family protein